MGESASKVDDVTA